MEDCLQFISSEKIAFTLNNSFHDVSYLSSASNRRTKKSFRRKRAGVQNFTSTTNMQTTIKSVNDRLNQLANHFVMCSHCEHCRKQQYIIYAIDNIRGELERALLPKSSTLLYTEPTARVKVENLKVYEYNTTR